ncbi:hypothetical protein IG631_02415 [Alternaria alternata]|nr:hypothetical protein IG631_02415 [Alternaria alternata]
MEARASAGGETHGLQRTSKSWACSVACAVIARVVRLAPFAQLSWFNLWSCRVSSWQVVNAH